MARGRRPTKSVMKIYVWIVIGAVLGIVCAACAPDFAWSEEPACLDLRCGSQKQPCSAATDGLLVELDRELTDAGDHLPSVALLPWVQSKKPRRCLEDRGCAEKERCLAGRCWRAPVSQAALRHWRTGQGALANSLPGWSAGQIGESSLRLTSRFGSESDGVWALYLGPRWVDAKARPIATGPGPSAMILVKAHHMGRWSEQVPELSSDGRRLRVAFPSGWPGEASYLWSLSCGQGLGVELFPAPTCEGEEPCVTFVFDKPLSLARRSCRVLVKLPGQAALASGWIGSAKDPASHEVLPTLGLGYGAVAW